MRGVARGWRVCVIQFVKSGKWKVGEEKIGLQLGVEWLKGGDGFTWDSPDLDESRGRALAAWKLAAHAIGSGEFDLVVLDEVTYPLNWGWIDAAEAIETIRTRPEHVNVVATGPRRPGGADRDRRHGDRDGEGQARLRPRHHGPARPGRRRAAWELPGRARPPGWPPMRRSAIRRALAPGRGVWPRRDALSKRGSGGRVAPPARCCSTACCSSRRHGPVAARRSSDRSRRWSPVGYGSIWGAAVVMVGRGRLVRSSGARRCSTDGSRRCSRPATSTAPGGVPPPSSGATRAASTQPSSHGPPWSRWPRTRPTPSSAPFSGARSQVCLRLRRTGRSTPSTRWSRPTSQRALPRVRLGLGAPRTTSLNWLPARAHRRACSILPRTLVPAAGSRPGLARAPPRRRDAPEPECGTRGGGLRRRTRDPARRDRTDLRRPDRAAAVSRRRPSAPRPARHRACGRAVARDRSTRRSARCSVCAALSWGASAGDACEPSRATQQVRARRSQSTSRSTSGPATASRRSSSERACCDGARRRHRLPGRARAGARQSLAATAAIRTPGAAPKLGACEAFWLLAFALRARGVRRLRPSWLHRAGGSPACRRAPTS